VDSTGAVVAGPVTAPIGGDGAHLRRAKTGVARVAERSASPELADGAAARALRGLHLFAAPRGRVVHDRATHYAAR
jgi:hypothetical protein